jgi:hypothetical protein
MDENHLTGLENSSWYNEIIVIHLSIVSHLNVMLC